MPHKLTDVILKELERFVLAGWRNSQLAAHYQVDDDTIRCWKKKLRQRHRDAWDQKPREFLAGCEAFFGSLEERALDALEAHKDLTATQQAALIKQARECRDSRITLRIKTGKINVVDADADPNKLSDEQVDKELAENEKKLRLLQPEKLTRKQRKPKRVKSGRSRSEVTREVARVKRKKLKADREAAEAAARRDLPMASGE